MNAARPASGGSASIRSHSPGCSQRRPMRSHPRAGGSWTSSPTRPPAPSPMPTRPPLCEMLKSISHGTPSGCAR
ncbi:hypothetical protein ACFQHO_40490 [Actinomadura yumaensis]|uniref:hypothetical protein n=1 Tax=Actinomadura yumaensis TaxID=111807 RepID=UPI00361183D9